MSDERQEHGHSGWDGDVAAYALGALDPAEAEAFRRHLETCPLCREELASFEGVVDALPMSVPSRRSPAGLRRRVMREATGRHGPGGVNRRQPGMWRWWPALRPVLAAAAVLGVVALVALRIQASGPPPRVISAQVTGGGTAQLRVSGDRGELVLRRFAPPPAGEIYEVWLQRGHGAPIPTTALFSVTAAGTGDVAVPGRLRNGTTVMVTPEPAGGSRVPTHAPVLRVSLS